MIVEMIVVRARVERIMLLMKGELVELGFRVWKVTAAVTAAVIRCLLNIRCRVTIVGRPDPEYEILLFLFHFLEIKWRNFHELIPFS